jgi:hypothetical protein
MLIVLSLPLKNTLRLTILSINFEKVPKHLALFSVAQSNRVWFWIELIRKKMFLAKKSFEVWVWIEVRSSDNQALAFKANSLARVWDKKYKAVEHTLMGSESGMFI